MTAEGGSSGLAPTVRPAQPAGARVVRLNWAIGRVVIGTLVVLFGRPRAYGRDRVPAEGGAVLAITHLHWFDIPLVGYLSPRNISFVAKIEATLGRGFGAYVRAYGTIAVRRGESDREAVRAMRGAARDGSVVGIFVEGTRQHTGRPGAAQPGAAIVAIQEGVPVIPVAVHGTADWRPGNFRRCTVAFGEPVRFDELPKNGRGYREATAEIEQRIHTLFDWLAQVDAQGRPRKLVPPL
jgi:1-acyl-sn-glycerol-3-phosphate acyltransferase